MKSQLKNQLWNLKQILLKSFMLNDRSFFYEMTFNLGSQIENIDFFWIFTKKILEPNSRP